MKRTHTSTSLFLVLWLAALIAGYMASRASIFAAAGGINCFPCKYCLNCNTLWQQNNNAYVGTVYDGSDSLAENAIFGPIMVPGNPVVYGMIDCSDTCDSNTVATGQLLEIVFYDSATHCNFNPGPNPPGNYDSMDGQGMTHKGVTLNQTLCTL
jgi:hypothetical protein